MKQAFIHATIWTSAGPHIADGTMITEDGKIVAVGQDLDTVGMTIVDCENHFILPGFIDAHTHTGVWGEGARDDYDGNEISEAITPYTRALDAIYPEDIGFEDARRGGVTTLGITHGSANPIGGQVAVAKTYGNVADDMVIKEPAGVKMALGENPKRVGEHLKRAPQSRMGVAYLVRQAFYAAMEYRKDWQHHHALVAEEAKKPEGDRQPLRGPQLDLGKEMLLKVLDGEIPVRNHAHRMDDIRTAIRLADEFGYRLVIEHATESYRIADEVAKRDVMLAIGPLFGERSKREVNKSTPATVGIMVERGCTVAIMTDSPFNPINNLRDLVIFAIREGLDPKKALATVTINPARILGVEDRVGSLEVGKDADFIIFDGDPWDARNKVQTTYIDGRNVFEASGPYIPD
ncbi:MAG: amidohydrolase [Acidimicrobiia bacterium]|nr:amidohydrolase [Acidimicrobiia bacterium]MDX2468021.1 amidohydrolase [Acidimicrobiia bacterium]